MIPVRKRREKKMPKPGDKPVVSVANLSVEEHGKNS